MCEAGIFLHCIACQMNRAREPPLDFYSFIFLSTDHTFSQFLPKFLK